MPTSEEVLPSAWEEEDGMELGTVLFRCRKLSKKSISVNIGEDVAGSYITPFFCGFGSLLASGVLLFLLLNNIRGDESGPLPYPWNRIVLALLLGTFPLGTAACFWCTFSRPKRATLTLFERGFSFGKRAFRFDDLERLGRGKPLLRVQQQLADFVADGNHPVLMALMGRHGRNMRKNVEVGLAKTGAKLQVQFANGQSEYLDNFLASFDPYDLETFFGLIRERHPHLLG